MKNILLSVLLTVFVFATGAWWGSKIQQHSNAVELVKANEDTIYRGEEYETGRMFAVKGKKGYKPGDWVYAYKDSILDLPKAIDHDLITYIIRDSTYSNDTLLSEQIRGETPRGSIIYEPKE